MFGLAVTLRVQLCSVLFFLCSLPFVASGALTVRGCPCYSRAFPENQATFSGAAGKQRPIRTNTTRVSPVSFLRKRYPKYLPWALDGGRRESRFPHDGAAAAQPGCGRHVSELWTQPVPAACSAPPPCARRSCPAPDKPGLVRDDEGVERPWHAAAGEGDAALAAGE